MKNLWIMICLICSGIGMVACDREVIQLDTPLNVSKTSAIKKGEPVNFSFNSDASIDRISWKVTPGKNVKISASGKNARISFGEAGNYMVTATDQEITARSAVTVDSSAYVPEDTLTVSDTLTTHVPEDTVTTTPPIPPVPKDTVKTTPSDTATIKPPVDTVGTHNIYVSLAGDHFTLTPTVLDTLSEAGLGFRIESGKSYNCLNASLSDVYFSKNPETKTASLHLTNVTQPGARYCQSGSKKVVANTFLFPLSEGENKIEVILNGNIYSGKVILQNKKFTIEWPDTSEVSFSKLILN